MAKKTDASTALKYLDYVSLRIFRYLSAFTFFAKEAEKLQLNTLGVSIDELSDLAKEARDSTVRPPSFRVPNEISRGVIDETNRNFQASIELEQRDVRELLRRGKIKKEDLLAHSELSSLINGGVEDLKFDYGSLSNAWDCLVRCKQRLTVPNENEFAIGSWFIASVSEVERLIREVVTLTIGQFGRHTLRGQTAHIFSDLSIEVSLGHLVESESTSEALGQVVLEFMRQNSGDTLNLAKRLAEAMRSPFLPDEPGFIPGLIQKLGWIKIPEEISGDSNTEKLFKTLLLWRHQIIHASQEGHSVASERREIALFHRQGSQDLRHLVEFLGGVGLRFAFDVIAKLLSLVQQSALPAERNELDVREWQLVAEMRVLHLEMLTAELWGLVWVTAEAIVQFGEPERQVMPKLNGLYARTRMGPEFASKSRHELRSWWAKISSEMEICGSKYDLLKCSILGEFDGIMELADAVFESGELSLAEIRDWPALEPFRQYPPYATWISGKEDR